MSRGTVGVGKFVIVGASNTHIVSRCSVVGPSAIVREEILRRFFARFVLRRMFLRLHIAQGSSTWRHFTLAGASCCWSHSWRPILRPAGCGTGTGFAKCGGRGRAKADRAHAVAPAQIQAISGRKRYDKPPEGIATGVAASVLGAFLQSAAVSRAVPLALCAVGVASRLKNARICGTRYAFPPRIHPVGSSQAPLVDRRRRA